MGSSATDSQGSSGKSGRLPILIGAAVLIAVVIIVVLNNRTFPDRKASDAPGQGSKNPQAEGLDGRWVSTGDPDPLMHGRFELEISKNSCRWIERTSGDQIAVSTAITIEDDKDIRIERPNDAKVLAFLFRPTVAGQVERRNPPPSFLQLRQDGDRLVGTWNGLQARTHGTDEVKETSIISKKCSFKKADHLK
jgi:hypothetical protein